MPQPASNQHNISENRSLDPTDKGTYTTGMRIFGGISWATILTVIISATLIVIPQVPRPWLWGIPPVWFTLGLIGIALQWSVARGACPKCGYNLVVPAMGKRCPQCRSYLKAENRTIVKV
jgi:hypothetical protein